MSTVKDVLEGKPLRCPIHPALVHLPIALFPISLILDIASWIWEDPELYLVRGAFMALVAGVVTGLLAAVFGFIDYSSIRLDHKARPTARLHMILNIVALVVFAISALLHYQQLDEVRTGIVPLILSVLGLGLIGYSGYLGGHLVYSDGVAVGRHRRETPAPHTTIAVGRATEAWIQVAKDGSLRNGETLRVDVNGTIVAVARVAGQVYAFQEFCTHRFGPLSEGALKGTDVVCPWHCSKFDIRTGKVTEGPAKIDLRTFRVQVRDGSIWIEAPKAAGA